MKESKQGKKICIKCGKKITGKAYTKEGNIYCCNICCKPEKDGKKICEFC